MTIDAARFQKLLGEFKLGPLFNELGWDRPTLKPQIVTANGENFTLTQLAHKRGVAVFCCSPDRTGKVPARPVLLKVEQEAAKLAYEHLLVFADAGETMLTWLWVSRTPGQPTTTRTHTWHQGQSGESLRQKLSQIVWSLEQEEAITLTDVIIGLRKAFDRDRISRSFYDQFKARHEAFAGFIEGLDTVADRSWYASLMLNRLMFVYFIQKKGFLDGDENYLRNRLAKVRATVGTGRFHSFYRLFLRRLFHEGLGQAKAERNPELARLIGDVPYLNGGLFSLHELEEAHPGIDIPDEAFERLFAFFDAWDWHLDDRPLRGGNEINPDVLGYIFEKYINQKQMGAYYTKEDITEYISKNTVVPHLIEQARERCKVAFDGEASVWNLLELDPDRYLYPAMKTGIIDAAGHVVPESALPDFVQTGMKDPKARMFDRRYNLGEAVFHTATGERGTLPTETWREYVERRTRCLAVRDKLARGEVKSADDLITLNLNLRQFMQDMIDTCTSPDLLRAVWQAIVGRVPEKANEKFRHGITILDPTCGSGAFLFAALNVLEPLYEACLERMEGFVEDARKNPSPSGRGAGVRASEIASPHNIPFPTGFGKGAGVRVPEEILRFARELRRQQTDAESLIWLLLRDRRLAGCKFRRQHPVAPYILDFYCHEAKLAIELDGGQHAENHAYDSERDAFLQAQGIRVLRFWNNQVLAETEGVLEAIWQALQSRAPSPPTPLPEGEGRIAIAPLPEGEGRIAIAPLPKGEGRIAIAPLPKGEGRIAIAPLPEGEGRRMMRGFADFENVLAEVDKHPSRRYYIFKSIILHNLFGVDLMAEAVEICKLRLFLKLVSQVDAGRELEPLPDIDFNIRAGNTLVGYATEAQFDAANTLASDQAHRAEIKARIADLADLFDRFREQQTVHGGKVTAEDKRQLRDRLSALSLELDRYLARDYGIDPDAISPLPPGEGSGVRVNFKAWRESHQPFHWFAEFYGVMREGGFDVVIGNPPYIEYSKVRNTYRLNEFATEAAGNLYAYVIERSYAICHAKSRTGMIVQLSSICTDRMSPLQQLYATQSKAVWSASYDDRPGKLFDGLEHIRAAILLSIVGNQALRIYSTSLIRWNTSFRPHLFDTTTYFETSDLRVDGSIPKIGSEKLISLIRKVRRAGSTLARFHNSRSQAVVYYYRSPLYWIRSMDFLPHFSSESAQRSVHHFKDFGLVDAKFRGLVGAIINSSLFYLWFIVYGNGRNVALRDISTFPVSFGITENADKYPELFSALMDDYKRHSVVKTRRDGVGYQEFYPSRSKSKMDQIDRALALEYCFNDEELDLIINYDIKYRMGGADDEE